MDSSSSPQRIVQLSDPHLMAAGDELMLGVNTDQCFTKVLTACQQHQPNLLVLTGDLSGCESPNSYQRLAEYLRQVSTAAVWLPGNHDDASAMQAFATEFMPGSYVMGNWQVILINSAVPRKIGGNIAAAQMQLIKQTLAASTADHVLFAVHHQVVNVGCAWIDSQKVANAEQLFELAAADGSVRGIIHGHTHQEFAGEVNGIKVLGAPSTWVQFAQNSDDFAIDEKAKPGFRILDLHNDGRIETEVQRVPVDMAIDTDTTHY